MEESLARHGQAVGLDFRFDLIERMPNSRRSHLLIAHAARHGLQGKIKGLLMEAYFQNGVDIGDLDALVRLGVEGGLAEHEARSALVLREGQDGVVAAERHAAVLGITAVPTYVFNGQYSMSGAQEPATLVRVLDQVAEFAAAAAAARALTPLELTGRARSHIVALTEPVCELHRHAVAPFLSLRRRRGRPGIELTPVSSFRDFDRQLSIWNSKYEGRRPVLDAAGRALDAGTLSPAERIGAILRWSALPGASRHHWGTDMDLIDANAVAPGYRVQLVPEEFEAAGPFARCRAWLDSHAGRFGFFRPFRGVRSGVQAEPWHFSFAPVAEGARRSLSVPVLQEALESAPLQGKEQVLANLEDLHARYVRSIDWP